jgi:GLPGLI family protein
MRFILLILISFQCFSQKGIEVIYKYESNFKKEIPEQILYGKFLKAAKKILPNYDFKLLADMNESIYYLKKELDNDAYPQEFKEMILRTANSNGIFYSDVSNNKFIEQKNAFGKLYKIISDFETFDWKIINEYKKISGFKCKKATFNYNVGNKKNNNQNREIVAWFTPEINYPFGPIGFRGLPGLILELNVNWDYSYKFEMSKIEFVDNLEINAPVEGETIKLQDYEKLNRSAVFQK